MNSACADKLVSIIIPVYNAEKYLKRCLDSVCSQTYNNLEIILIDDGSKDKSLFLCEERAKIDCRIRVVSKMNEGQGKARNIGLDIMTGEYVLFVDSDDYINLDMVRCLLEAAENYGADMVQCLYQEVEETQVIDNTKIVEGVKGKIRVEDYKQRGLLCYYTEDILPVNKLIHKSLLISNRFPEGIFYEDKHLMFRLRHQAQKIVYIDAIMYYYVQSENSTMRNDLDEKRLMSKIQVADELLEYCKKYGLIRDYKSEMSGYLRMYVSIFFKTYKKEQFHKYTVIAKQRLQQYLPELRNNEYVTGKNKILVGLLSININSLIILYYLNNFFKKIRS